MSKEAFVTLETNFNSNARANDWLVYLNSVDYMDPDELKERTIKNLLLDKNLSIILLAKICDQLKVKAKEANYISINEGNYLICPVCREKAAYVIGPTKSIPLGAPKWKYDLNPYTIQCPWSHRWNHEPYTGDKVKGGASTLTGTDKDVCWDGRAWVAI